MLKYQFTFLLLFVLCPELSPQGDEKVKKPKTTHPLDPLTRKEIEDAAFFLAEHHGNPRNLVMPLLTLDEPTKKELAQHRQGKSIARRARAVVLDTAKSLTIEAVIDLSKGKVQIWRPLPGLKSVMTPAEGDAAELIVNADPRWQKALKDRGITNLNEVYLATWASDGSMSGSNE